MSSPGAHIADAAGSAVLTAEEFYARYAGRAFELLRGRPLPLTPTGPVHGRVDSRIARRLGQQIEERKLGELFSNTGFILSRGPDLVRGPDQAFVSAAKLGQNPPPESGFWELVPDLVVEVVSPNDSAEQIAEKVADYLGAGVSLLWIVYPRLRQVHVFRPGAAPRIVAGDVSLEGEDVLPGVQLTLGELWR